MDGDGGGDGRADTLRHGLAHRQRHQRRQHGERVAIRSRHAGNGFPVPGLRHPRWALCGLRLIGLCRQPPKSHVPQYPALCLLRHRQIFHPRPCDANDDGREQPAECLSADSARDGKGSVPTDPVDCDVPGHRRPSQPHLHRSDDRAGVLTLQHHLACGKALPTGVREVRRTEPERAGEHTGHPRGESLRA